jgi:hypothetical protein
MNYSPSFSGHGNLPPGCTQAAIDAVFGCPFSDRAIEAMDCHVRVQALISLLQVALRTDEGTLGFAGYEDLQAALNDASMTGDQIEAAVADAEIAEKD